MVQLLLDKGAIVNNYDNNGNSVLHLAISNDYMKMVRTLLETVSD